MEIKATLQKPYTKDEYMDFIVEQNHHLGYEIRETENSLQAWGYTEEEQFIKAKQLKYEENDTKASKARYNQEFELEIQEQLCVFDTSEQTQRDLLTAFAVCSTGETYDGWVTNNGVVLNLTIEDIALISQVFKQKSNVYGKWNEYKTLIDEATTIEEVQAIVIDYGVNE